MPLVRIDLRKGKDPTYRQEIGRVVYEAMVAVAGVPANARFQVVSEHDADNFLKENWSVGKGEAQYASWKDAYWEGTAGQRGGES